jgi:hypothetical protein
MMPKCYLCHEPYPAKREELGYKTCLDCGGAAANVEKQRKARCSAPAYFICCKQEAFLFLTPIYNKGSRKVKRRTEQEIEEMKRRGVRFHRHHINPRHNDGGNEAENLILLTVEEHAEAHKKLYEQYGRVQDLIAYKALSGKCNSSEARRLARVAVANSMWTDDRREKAREANKRARVANKLSNIGDIMRDTEFSEEHKRKLSEAAISRAKVECPFCGVSATKQTISRHHGDGKCNIEPDLNSDKRCRDCGEVKKLADYPASGKKQNGHVQYKNWCKMCENKRRRDRRRR